jgi:hypothetical protein
MRRNHGNESRYPGLYRHDELERRRIEAGLSIKEVSRLTGVKVDSARRVFLGEAHQKQVKPIADYFEVDWSQLHDFNLNPKQFDRRKFDRAVLNGNSKTARSCGPKSVGGLRPAPV